MVTTRFDRLCALLASVPAPVLAPGERERIQRESYPDIERLTLSIENETSAAVAAGR